MNLLITRMPCFCTRRWEWYPVAVRIIRINDGAAVVEIGCRIFFSASIFDAGGCSFGCNNILLVS